MAVNNYTRECKYNLNKLDNYIYLYEFNEPILNYITDDDDKGVLNGLSSSLVSESYRIYCEDVQYQSSSSINNRFSFTNTLTISLSEHNSVTHYKVIQKLLNNKWMVLFKNEEGDSFIMNAEYPVMMSYEYVFNDEKTPNNLTITFSVIQNVPTINYNGIVTYSSTLRDKPCEYSISRIESFKMIDINKCSVSITEDGFNLIENGRGSLKTIEFNPTSLSFSDSYDGREYIQSLSFQIPFDSYLYYFHYNLLEFLENRYIALIKTTNGNNILAGFRQGLFPSYTISTAENGSNITITLTAKYTTYSVLGSDVMKVIINEDMFYKPITGECVSNLYTYTLLEQYHNNGLATGGYYCLEGYEDVYENDYNILGTYNRFDTTFGVNIIDYNIECQEDCKIRNLPPALQFEKSGETQCYIIASNCSVEWEWNKDAIDLTYDSVSHKLCVTSKVDNATVTIKATLGDGTMQYVTTIIGDGNITGDATNEIFTSANAQKLLVVLLKGMKNIKEVDSVLQFQKSEDGNGYIFNIPENDTLKAKTYTITVTYEDGSVEKIIITQDRIYYRVIQSNETECYGKDLYYVNKRYKGYDMLDVNIFVGNEKGNLKETDSIKCMDYDDIETECSSCYEGYKYDLVEYKKNGAVVAVKYEKTNETCNENATTFWLTNTAKTTCENAVAYYVDELYGLSCKNSNVRIKLYPNIERTSDVKAPNSHICGTIDPDSPSGTIYRWVDTNETYCLSNTAHTNCESKEIVPYKSDDPDTYLCIGGNKYQKVAVYNSPLCNGEKSFMGYDKGSLLEENSEGCQPNTLYRWIDTNETYCIEQ